MSIIPFERSYWVISNKLIAGEIPASYNEEESKIKLMRLVEIDTKVVINLQEENEKNYQNQLFYDYASFLNKNNVFETIDYLKRTTSISNRMSPETKQQKDFILAWNANQ
jgi:hypothetical protein